MSWDQFSVKMTLHVRAGTVTKIIQIPKIVKMDNRAVPNLPKSQKVMPRTRQSLESTIRNLSKCIQIGSHRTQKLRFLTPRWEKQNNIVK